MPVKRVSALSQVIKEAQKSTPTPPVSDEQDTAKPQDGNTVLQQSSTTVVSQPTASRVPGGKTPTRDKMTFYLNPGQRDKLDDLRRAYKDSTGQRINEQDLMRLIVDKITLGMLLPEPPGE